MSNVILAVKLKDDKELVHYRTKGAVGKNPKYIGVDKDGNYIYNTKDLEKYGVKKESITIPGDSKNGPKTTTYIENKKSSDPKNSADILRVIESKRSQFQNKKTAIETKQKVKVYKPSEGTKRGVDVNKIAKEMDAKYKREGTQLKPGSYEAFVDESSTKTKKAREKALLDMNKKFYDTPKGLIIGKNIKGVADIPGSGAQATSTKYKHSKAYDKVQEILKKIGKKKAK